MKAVVALFAVLLIAGCATKVQERYSHLETGMTRQRLDELLGPPKRSTNYGALTTLEYDFTNDYPNRPGRTSYYVVVGRDGRVRSFGLN